MNQQFSSAVRSLTAPFRWLHSVLHWADVQAELGLELLLRGLL